MLVLCTGPLARRIFGDSADASSLEIGVLRGAAKGTVAADTFVSEEKYWSALADDF
jgi:hypothetical protein